MYATIPARLGPLPDTPYGTLYATYSDLRLTNSRPGATGGGRGELFTRYVSNSTNALSCAPDIALTCVAVKAQPWVVVRAAISAVLIPPIAVVLRAGIPVVLDSALLKDPNYAPALADRAMLAVRSGEYAAARKFAMTALAVDSYDAAANYYYGIANRRLGRLTDAKDGFEIAVLSAEFRGAAWTELAKMTLAQGNARGALAYAQKALTDDAANLDALGVATAILPS